LIRIDFEHNKLTTLIPGIGNLINLTSLSLKFNELNTLPEEIGNLINKLGFKL